MNPDELVEIIKYMKRSKRPTLHGRILRNIDLDDNIYNKISTKLYDFYVGDKGFDMSEIIGEQNEVIEKI